jgi:hypothetical protein
VAFDHGDGKVDTLNYEANDEWDLTNISANSLIRTADEGGNVVISQIYMTIYLQVRV